MTLIINNETSVTLEVEKYENQQLTFISVDSSKAVEFKTEHILHIHSALGSCIISKNIDSSVYIKSFANLKFSSHYVKEMEDTVFVSLYD